MTNPQNASKILRHYYSTVSDDEYKQSAKRYNPQVVSSSEHDSGEDPQLAQLGLPGLTTEALGTAPLRATPVEYPLNAYLACALTGLEGEQRQLMFQLSDTISVVCDDLGISVYEPRKKTDPVHHPDVADSEVFHTDRERVVRSDLVIYLAHYPSTGAGEELDFAYNAMVPIVVVHHGDSRLSRMVTGIPGMVLTVGYLEPEELRVNLRAALTQIRPQLVQRNLAFGDHDVNIVGDRIRRLRESQGLTRADVAAVSTGRFPLSEEILERIEQASDKESNPSLIQLREIATALGVSVADLVEPNMEEIVLSAMSSWVADHQAARFGGASIRDRNKLLRRLLLRLIDSLEDE